MQMHQRRVKERSARALRCSIVLSVFVAGLNAGNVISDWTQISVDEAQEILKLAAGRPIRINSSSRLAKPRNDRPLVDLGSRAEDLLVSPSCDTGHQLSI